MFRPDAVKSLAFVFNYLFSVFCSGGAVWF